MNDNVKHPSHYTEGRKYEPKDVIRDWGLNFNMGNAVKYLSRAGRKGDKVEDLRKAMQYIQFELDALGAGAETTESTPKAETPKPEYERRALALYNAYMYALDSFSKELEEKSKGLPPMIISNCVFKQEMILRKGFDPVEVLEHLTEKLMRGEGV